MCYSIEQNVGYVTKPNSYTIRYCGMKDMSWRQENLRLEPEPSYLLGRSA